MDEDWRNAFGILMCKEICEGAGAGICDGVPSTCSNFLLTYLLLEKCKMSRQSSGYMGQKHRKTTVLKKIVGLEKTIFTR